MAFSTTARIVCCGPVRRQPPAFAVARSVSSSSAHQQLSRRGDVFGNLSVRSTSNRLLRWNVAKPGRGGRLLVEAAHSAIPKAAGLFNPANDKVVQHPILQACAVEQTHTPTFAPFDNPVSACMHVLTLQCWELEWLIVDLFGLML